MCDARAPEPEQAGRWKASTLIKTFGQDMMADPGFAANIIEPLKMQGVERFGDFAIQIRRGEQRIDAQQVVRPGTILVFLEPLHEGGLDGVTPGSSCIANAYTSNHDLIGSGNVGATRGLVLHAVDALGLVHAMILRIQALVLPIRTLVFSGH